MINLTKKLLLIFVFGIATVNAQDNEAVNLKIAKHFSDYYELER